MVACSTTTFSGKSTMISRRLERSAIVEWDYSSSPPCRVCSAVEGQPAAIHASMVAWGQRTRRPNWAGNGIRPASQSRSTCRVEQPSALATTCLSGIAATGSAGWVETSDMTDTPIRELFWSGHTTHSPRTKYPRWNGSRIIPAHLFRRNAPRSRPMPGEDTKRKSRLGPIMK